MISWSLKRGNAETDSREIISNYNNQQLERLKKKSIYFSCSNIRYDISNDAVFVVAVFNERRLLLIHAASRSNPSNENAGALIYELLKGKNT